MKSKSIQSLLLVLSMAVIYMSCIHELPQPPGDGSGNGNNNPPPTPPPSGAPCSKDTVYFVNTIQPIILSSCAMTGCHDAISHEEGLNLTTYDNIMKIVKAGSATSSKLYTEIVRTDGDRMPPAPMAPMPADQITKIKTWINQGAKNNRCDACDPLSFTFSKTIQPMMANKCQGCHNPNNLGGGVDLSTYNGIKASALSGRLYGTINWSAGFSAMPKGGSKLQDCEIQQVKSWIDAGAQNN